LIAAWWFWQSSFGFIRTRQNAFRRFTIFKYGKYCNQRLKPFKRVRINPKLRYSMKKEINGHPFIKYETPFVAIEAVEKQATHFYENMNARRTVRDFSDKPVPKSVIEKLILTASTAPSGAHKQPWTFCAISKNRLELPQNKRNLKVIMGVCPNNG
jgi:hypothetical protein